MERSLADRFHYGISGRHSPFVPHDGLADENRKRETEVVYSARQQINAQHDAAREIAGSHLKGAHIIMAEIEEQTEELDAAANAIGERIVKSILSAADQISESIDIIGDRICVELTEIRWQLTQQDKTLEEILEVLHQSRHNEARQLVHQGLRHYINEEYEEAEERFKLALNFDTTDYQVLMNLAFIEIHKGNASQAIIFFKKALSLPENLDSIARARTLWSMARLCYAEHDFEKAYAYAGEAFKLDNQSAPRVFYDLGVYAALAGRKSDALKKIEQSILIDFSYFSKCAADPNLENMREDVLQLLDRLSVDAESTAKAMVEEAENELAVLEDEEQLKRKDDVIKEARKIVNIAVDGLQKPTYSFCRRCAEVMKRIQIVISQIRDLISLYARLKKSQDDFDGKNRIYLTMRQQHDPEKDVPRTVYIIMIFITYILPGYLLANAGSAQDGIPWLLLFIIWPFWIVLNFLWTHSGITHMAAGGMKGLFAAGAMWVIVSFLHKRIRQNSNRINRDIARMEQQFYLSERTLISIRKEITARNNIIKEQLAGVRL